MSKDNIVEVVLDKKPDVQMKCPFRLEQVNYQKNVAGIVENHQRADFTDCYLEGCFFYKNKQCRKVEYDIAR